MDHFDDVTQYQLFSVLFKLTINNSMDRLIMPNYEKRPNLVKHSWQTKFPWVSTSFFKKHCIFTTFDMIGPAVRLYFCLNKNLGKACFCRSGLLRLLHFQVWNWSKVIQNFSVKGDDHDLKFVFAFACQVIRNFTETYDWMTILASNPLLMSTLLPRHLNPMRPIFTGKSSRKYCNVYLTRHDNLEVF